jgi:L-rhamnose isomerase
MSKAVERANEMEKKESGWIDSSTTPKFSPTGKYANRLRPWIQDFNYGKVYTEADVRAQKKAVYDSHLTSWMAWDPSNRYTPSAFSTTTLSSSTTAITVAR